MDATCSFNEAEGSVFESRRVHLKMLSKFAKMALNLRAIAVSSPKSYQNVTYPLTSLQPSLKGLYSTSRKSSSSEYPNGRAETDRIDVHSPCDQVRRKRMPQRIHIDYREHSSTVFPQSLKSRFIHRDNPHPLRFRMAE